MLKVGGAMAPDFPGYVYDVAHFMLLNHISSTGQ